MIKLFRNIRKKLLAEGKTAKYFKYAIGEIILVVIGILIALQINNWNEDRKEHRQKKELVRSMIVDLTIKKEEIQQDKKSISQVDSIIRTTLDVWDKEQSLDSLTIPRLIQLIGIERAYFGESTQTYEGAASTEIWRQLPDSIVREIINLHIGRFEKIKRKYEVVTTQGQNITLNYLVPNNLHNPQLKLETLHHIIMKNPEKFFSYVILFGNHVTEILKEFDSSLLDLEKVTKSLQHYLKTS